METMTGKFVHNLNGGGGRSDGGSDGGQEEAFFFFDHLSLMFCSFF